MGAGIAIVAARAGFSTICYDVGHAGARARAQQTEGFFAKSVERGKMSAADKDAVMGAPRRARPTLDDLAAVRPRHRGGVRGPRRQARAVRQARTRSVRRTRSSPPTPRRCRSPRSPAGSGRDDRVVGMHFCLPAQLMKLIEMSPGLDTWRRRFATAWAWCEAVGQIPVKTQDKPGFILNSLLIPFNNDCIRAVEAGVASAADIDTAIKTGARLQDGAARAARPGRPRHAGAARARRSIPSRSIRARRRRRCCAAWSRPAGSAARAGRASTSTTATRCSEAEA